MNLKNCYLFFVLLITFVWTSCGTYKNQTHQVTEQAKEKKFIDSCEVYAFQKSLEILAQTRGKWKDIDFSDSKSVEGLMKYIQVNVVDSIRVNKNYIKIKNKNKEYTVVESEFYRKLFNHLSKQENKTFWDMVYHYLSPFAK